MVTQEIRNKKALGYDQEQALERWIQEMCEVYEVPRSEIVNLAIVKLERERIESLGYETREM
jgi:hypothetical protein